MFYWCLPVKGLRYLTTKDLKTIKNLKFEIHARKQKKVRDKLNLGWGAFNPATLVKVWKHFFLRSGKFWTQKNSKRFKKQNESQCFLALLKNFLFPLLKCNERFHGEDLHNIFCMFSSTLGKIYFKLTCGFRFLRSQRKVLFLFFEDSFLCLNPELLRIPFLRLETLHVTIKKSPWVRLSPVSTYELLLMRNLLWE